MANRACITYKGDPETLKRDFKEVIKALLQEVARDWHEKTLPEHFKTSANGKYNLRKRTKKYMIRKARKYGHQRPLVWSGDLERQAKRRVRLSGTSKRAKATMAVPWYATKHFKGNATYEEEMTAVTQGEAQDMAQQMKKMLEDRLNNLKNHAAARTVNSA